MFKVMLLDTLNYDNIAEARNIAQSTKNLLKILCQVTDDSPLKVRSLNVAVQEDNGTILIINQRG